MNFIEDFRFLVLFSLAINPSLKQLVKGYFVSGKKKGVEPFLGLIRSVQLIQLFTHPIIACTLSIPNPYLLDYSWLKLKFYVKKMLLLHNRYAFNEKASQSIKYCIGYSVGFP